MKLEPYLSPYEKVTQSIRILEENLGNTILDISLRKELVILSSKAISTKTKIDKWDIIKELLHNKRNYH